MKWIAGLLAFVCVSANAECLLEGDSIRIGFQQTVMDLVPGVSHIPGNGHDTWTALEKAPKWFGTTQYKQIYVEIGFWDIAHRCPVARTQWNPCGPAPFPTPITTTKSEFRNNLGELVDLIRAYQPNAIIILATMTPVPVGANGRAPEDAIIYNAIIRSVAEGKGVQLDDLHALMLPHVNLHKDSTNIHWNALGYQHIGKHIAALLEDNGGC